MHAQVGDRLVVEGNHVGAARREGTVVELLSPPGGHRYRVQWDDGHETMFCPSADTRVEHRDATQRPSSLQRTVTQVELRFEEDEDHTDAWASLRTPTETFSGWGRARRNPVDDNIPLVGEELAAARALIALADRLRLAAGEALDHKQQPAGHLVS